VLGALLHDDAEELTAPRRARIAAADAAEQQRQGVENTRINEITDEADVGFGFFYNHFESEAAIVEAVLVETVAARGGTVDAVTARLDDPAEVIAAAHRHFARLARSDPEWGWLVVRGNLSHDVVLAGARPVRRAARHQAWRAVRAPVRWRRPGGAL
jgi:AcrR family transcriptional regulator